MSHVTYHMSPVSYHQSLQPQPKTLPLPTPPLRTLKPKTISKPNLVLKPTKQLKVLRFAILVICSTTRSLKLSWFRMPTEGTNTQQAKKQTTYRLNWPRDWFSKKVNKRRNKKCKIISKKYRKVRKRWIRRKSYNNKKGQKGAGRRSIALVYSPELKLSKNIIMIFFMCAKILY